ncbi:MAG: transposase [Spirochaetales bacterium]|nr:transposase [Spirochaetales bacterium]
MAHRKTLLEDHLAKYRLNQWVTLVRFLEHEEITPDNNAAENACGLIETAKLNGKEPYAYLRYILHQLPLVEQSADWGSLLPWNVTLV